MNNGEKPQEKVVNLSRDNFKCHLFVTQINQGEVKGYEVCPAFIDQVIKEIMQLNDGDVLKIKALKYQGTVLNLLDSPNI
jgi:hypothetical protein